MNEYSAAWVERIKKENISQLKHKTFKNNFTNSITFLKTATPQLLSKSNRDEKTRSVNQLPRN